MQQMQQMQMQQMKSQVMLVPGMQTVMVAPNGQMQPAGQMQQQVYFPAVGTVGGQPFSLPQLTSVMMPQVPQGQQIAPQMYPAVPGYATVMLHQAPSGQMVLAPTMAAPEATEQATVPNPQVSAPQARDGTSQPVGATMRKKRTESELLTETLRVLSSTPVPGIAGSVAKRLRQCSTAKVECVGAEGVNQALKGLALAREFLLSESKSLMVYPVRAGAGFGRDNRDSTGAAPADVDVALDVSVAHGDLQHLNTDLEVRVRAESDIERTAASIVGQKMETGLSMVGMGVQCVSVCVYSLRLARELLKKTGCDLAFRPRWRKVEASSSDVRSAIQFDVYFSHSGVVNSRASTPPPPTVETDDEEDVYST